MPELCASTSCARTESMKRTTVGKLPLVEVLGGGGSNASTQVVVVGPGQANGSRRRFWPAVGGAHRRHWLHTPCGGELRQHHLAPGHQRVEDRHAALCLIW